MPLFPEREKPTIQERPEEFPEIPVEVENKSVVGSVPTQFRAQVKSDTGQPLIQSPQTQVVAIQIPADQAQLMTTSKGSVANSLTWLAVFWLRMIKKALHFGWKVVKKSDANPNLF